MVGDYTKHVGDWFPGVRFFDSKFIPQPQVSDLTDRVVKSFTDKAVDAKLLQQATIFYRVSGGRGGPTGSYLSRTKSTSRAAAIENFALGPKTVGNTAEWISEVHVPKDIPIYEGTAAKLEGLAGGGNQIFIPREFLDDEWFKPRSPLN